jgi:ABC-2 type transport system permease protein
MSKVVDFITKTLVITELEVRKLRHDPMDLLTRAVQPTLWLLIFGQVFTKIRAIPTGDLRYIDFMSPGILSQSVLFVSIFYGIGIIWERDLGISQKFLVAPIARESVILGKALSAGVRGISQGFIIYILSLIIGVKVNLNPFAMLGIIVTIIIGSALFSTFSMMIACLVKTRERFMGIGQVLSMPLFFASNAIYPISIMPTWLQIISKGNPVTYMVDAIRSLMLSGYNSAYGLALDFLVLISVLVVFIFLAGKLYPRIAS